MNLEDYLSSSLSRENKNDNYYDTNNTKVKKFKVDGIGK